MFIYNPLSDAAFPLWDQWSSSCPLILIDSTYSRLLISSLTATSAAGVMDIQHMFIEYFQWTHSVTALTHLWKTGLGAVTVLLYQIRSPGLIMSQSRVSPLTAWTEKVKKDSRAHPNISNTHTTYIQPQQAFHVTTSNYINDNAV